MRLENYLKIINFLQIKNEQFIYSVSPKIILSDGGSIHLFRIHLFRCTMGTKFFAICLHFQLASLNYLLYENPWCWRLML